MTSFSGAYRCAARSTAVVDMLHVYIRSGGFAVLITGHKGDIGHTAKNMYAVRARSCTIAHLARGTGAGRKKAEMLHNSDELRTGSIV